MTRLIDNPGDFVRKAYVSARIGLGTAPLRTLIGRYLGDPTIRRQIRYHDLMNDLVKLDVIRRVRGGTLRARQPFHVTVGFDAEAGLLMLTSIAPRTSEDGAVNGDARAQSDGVLEPAQLEEALKHGRVKVIVWDHSALSLEIVYAPLGRKWITVGIGTGGVHRFDALIRLARHDAAWMTSVLMPILRGEPLGRGTAP
jgi:hypothetical protein